MPVLNIKDDEAYALASEIAKLTGKSLTRVVKDALQAEKNRLTPVPTIDWERVRVILDHVDSLPVLDDRPVEETIEQLYDENGLWK